MARHDTREPAAPALLVEARPHRPVEDVVALLIGSLALSFGLVLLKDVGGVSGGIAGIAFLVTYSTGWSFSLVFFLINIPFYVLAVVRLGWMFTLKTFAVVGLISVFTEVHTANVALDFLSPFYACALGGMFMGLGFLVLFRHRASAGGLGIFVLYVQERFGYSAGMVQLCFDSAIVLAALLVVDLPTVLASVLGVVVLNVILAMNHRPGRYRA
ncbi:YitT family protein [Sanguibacter suaedae]|uniref:YitT family protein n=1 Tax=Sanguibacter suaedae TaxID=2795737 RepID=A0A934I948_9MICO|nr:YitT family protein [Sanguibacter suaedae]MBI9113505.1 YitT family protein [Sanguibacter suaedae]